MERKVDLVLNSRTGKIINSDLILNGLTEQQKHELRAIQFSQTEYQYCCPVCDQPVYPAGSLEKTYYFKHFAERGECLLKYGRHLSKDVLKAVLMAEELPDDIPPDLERILDALFFLKTGSLAHMGLRNIKEVTNLILSHYKEHAIIYLHGFKQYRHDMNLDNLGSKLSKKAKKICDEVRGYRKMGRPDGQKMEYNVLMRLLFPELENHLR